MLCISVFTKNCDKYCYYVVLVTVLFVITNKEYVCDDIRLFKIPYYDLECEETNLTLGIIVIV